MTDPPAGGWTRHLLWFCLPVAGNGVWQRNCAELLRRIDLFNGKRVVAVATAGGPVSPPMAGKESFTVDPPDAVRAALAGRGCEFIEVANDAAAGESAAFGPLWRAVERCAGFGDVTFYGHAKGVSYPGPACPVHEWTRLLYAVNLDHWPLVERAFSGGAAVCGTMRRLDRKPRWHFSGTFYWFRNWPTFRRNWDVCPPSYGGVERWPGLVFRRYESRCLFTEVPPGRSAYDRDWLDETAAKFVTWSEQNRPREAAR